MKGKKCNGYRQICGYKGKPIIEMDFTLSFSKKPNIGYFCIDCCKNYIKYHSDMHEETRLGIGLAIAFAEKDSTSLVPLEGKKE